MEKHKNKLPFMAGILFLLNAVTSVAYAWIKGVHRFDLGISFSSYVGLFRRTSVVYFISAIVMVPALGYYVAKTRMPKLKKAFYIPVLICIFGTAFFPFNTFSEAPTPVTIDLHNDFAVALMLFTLVTFIITAATAKDRRQRITALVSIAYAVIFAVLFFTGAAVLFRVFFVYEVTFIILLLTALVMERCGDTAADIVNG
ncbi:MAG: hypothetical protein J6M17_06325 [Ruminococcus sp.]|nr:hypothetical protein [Ruminococcus sp.]